MLQTHLMYFDQYLMLDWLLLIAMSTYVYMTKCQKVRKSWVKILTVNKIWSN